MDRARGAAPAIRRAGSVALITGLLGVAGLGLAGCTSSSSSPGAGSSPGTASASPGLSVPGTHKATARYQITAPVSTVVIVSHVGNVTVTGGSGPGVSVTQQVYYSKTAADDHAHRQWQDPHRYLRLPRAARLRRGLHAGRTAFGGGPGDRRRRVGPAHRAGRERDRQGGCRAHQRHRPDGASVSLTTRVGGISASFTAAPTAVRASANVGAITVHVPGTTSYKVAADARVGKTTVSARQSASSGHAITATTDVGAIVVAPST